MTLEAVYQWTLISVVLAVVAIFIGIIGFATCMLMLGVMKLTAWVLNGQKKDEDDTKGRLKGDTGAPGMDGVPGPMGLMGPPGDSCAHKKPDRFSEVGDIVIDQMRKDIFKALDEYATANAPYVKAGRATVRYVGGSIHHAEDSFMDPGTTRFKSVALFELKADDIL